MRHNESNTLVIEIQCVKWREYFRVELIQINNEQTQWAIARENVAMAVTTTKNLPKNPRKKSSVIGSSNLITSAIPAFLEASSFTRFCWSRLSPLAMILAYAISRFDILLLCKGQTQARRCRTNESHWIIRAKMMLILKYATTKLSRWQLVIWLFLFRKQTKDTVILSRTPSLTWRSRSILNFWHYGTRKLNSDTKHDKMKTAGHFERGRTEQDSEQFRCDSNFGIRPDHKMLYKLRSHSSKMLSS